MMYFINVIAVIILSLVGYVRGNNGAQVQANDNAEQFALLCRIYNVAKNPPIHHVDLQDPLKIVDEIDTLNASFAMERRLNETDLEGGSVNAQLKTTMTREAAVAQAILRHITQKTRRILEEIKKINVTETIEKAKAEFTQVIFGEGYNESDLCHGALKGVSDRAAACGNQGLSSRGDSAGNNLIVDFFCLCAMSTDKEGIGSVCGGEVGGKGGKSKPDNHGWDSKGPFGSASMWASVKKECGKHLHHHPKSTSEGHEVLEDFLKHLKFGGLYRWGDTDKVKGSDRKKGMLGTGVGKEGEHGNDVLCDGRKGEKNGGRTVNPAGVCVYYGPDNWEDNVAWLKRFKTALASVDAVNNQTATIQRAFQKLQMLQRRAEEIYETTKVISEIQNPVVPTAFQNASGSLTAYNAVRARSYSYSSHTYFIPVWALFLK